MIPEMQPLPHPEYAEVSYRAALEGMVLLENDGVLPLKEKRVALFGAGAVDTIYCGTGSGAGSCPWHINVREGLEKGGFEITSGAWLNAYQELFDETQKQSSRGIVDIWSGIHTLVEEPLLTEEALQEAKADTAVYVIRRSAGESEDRRLAAGDYYLSENERHNLEMTAAAYAHTIVVLNCCVIDTAFYREIPGLSALVLMGQAGMECGTALAELLSGRADFSGRLTDSWPLSYEDCPAKDTFADHCGSPLQSDYKEGIYVGYRFFDSFGKEAAYPFGYGKSYTSFAMETVEASADWNSIALSVKVTNMGSMPGREVVQVYVSAPSGRLEKPFQELKGFAKTGLLAPKEAQKVTVSIPTESLASYDEECACMVLEAGKYLIRVGTNSRCSRIAAVLMLDQETAVRRLSNQVRPDHPLAELGRRGVEPVSLKCGMQGEGCEEENGIIALTLSAADCITIDGASHIEPAVTTYIPAGSSYRPAVREAVDFPVEERVEEVTVLKDARLIDVLQGRITMETFVAGLEEQVLARLVSGAGTEIPYEITGKTLIEDAEAVQGTGSGTTTDLFVKSLGIPNTILCDGPAGIHMPAYSVVAYPSGTVLAQTWNPEVLRECGDTVGKEMEHYDITVILGPGMNIHRDPLCGRNFEYYSEDPLLTGKMGAAFIMGVQSHPGRGVSVKHFCANNQETERFDTNATIGERALREIYLKGFEIAVKEGKPMTVMTSYNKVNGYHTSSHYELITNILRGEWGFDGYVMTDWGTHSDKVLDLHAGNDMIMPSVYPDEIISGIMPMDPVFDADGYVHVYHLSMFGGFSFADYPEWNGFTPDAEGTELVSCTVAAGTELNPAVEECISRGTAEVVRQADGSRLVTYRGRRAAIRLTLGELQRSAANVLRQHMKTSGMKKIYHERLTEL